MVMMVIACGDWWWRADCGGGVVEMTNVVSSVGGDGEGGVGDVRCSGDWWPKVGRRWVTAPENYKERECVCLGTDVVSYNQSLQELVLMCIRMFPEDSDEIEKYVSGLPDMIHGSVMASKPKTMQDSIKFSTELVDKKISTLVERQAENKMKLDKNNQAQQQPPKKQGVAIPYTIGPSERKEYAGTLPLCNK
nr:hypothetical protein [Tanacetum cinerariifolium]